MSIQTKNEKQPILQIQGLKKHFPVKSSLGFLGGAKGNVKAVNDVSFELFEGETFGLVGESGCGKSTLGRTILRLTEPTEGKAIYKNNDVFKLPPKSFNNMRQELQMVFQIHIPH